MRSVYPVLCIKIRFVTGGIYEEQLLPKCLVGGLFRGHFPNLRLAGQGKMCPRNSITVFGALKSPALPTLATDLHLHAAGWDRVASSTTTAILKSINVLGCGTGARHKSTIQEHAFLFLFSSPNHIHFLDLFLTRASLFSQSPDILSLH